MLTTYLQDLRREFRGYNAKIAQADIMSGITVAAVALPLALAFGVGSGADAAAGLITAILAGFIIGALSGAAYQISGPTGAMTAILISVIAHYKLQGMFVACLLSGVFLLIAGVCRLGRLVSFIPMPVISGFTSGMSIVIALGQLGNFLDVPLHGEDTLQKVGSLFTYLQQPDTWVRPTAVSYISIGMGLFTIALMLLWPKKWGSKLPASIVAVVVTLLLTTWLDLPVTQVGAIPRTLLPDVRLTLDTIPWTQLSGLLMPAFSIAALGMIESLLCGVAGGRMSGGTFNADRELVAQGIGNMLIPFFGGVPATAAIARTSVGIKSGGKTRLMGIIHAVVLLISMFLLAPIMSRIPLATLASVLLVTAWRMNEWSEIRYIFSKRMKSAMAQFLVTVVITVAFDLTIAIAVGVGFSMLLFVAQSSNMGITVQEVDRKRLQERGVTLSESIGKMQVAYLSGPLFFASIDKLQSVVKENPCDILVLSMRGVSMIDTSGMRGLEELLARLRGDNVTVLFAAMQETVRHSFDRCGLTDVIGAENFYWSTDLALAQFGQQRTETK